MLCILPLRGVNPADKLYYLDFDSLINKIIKFNLDLCVCS